MNEPITRSSRAEVRNPVIALPAARQIAAMPRETRLQLANLLSEMAADARDRAQHCWRKHKAPMAVYWKVVAVYSRHIAAMLRKSNDPSIH